tara:strand:+ start:597 stop:929 length:333 start_codon:yes stop_codon:yes gene_type:complete
MRRKLLKQPSIVLPSVIKLEGVLASIKNNERKDGAAEGNETRRDERLPKRLSEPKQTARNQKTVKLHGGPMKLSARTPVLKMPPRLRLPRRSAGLLPPHGYDLPPKKLVP